ncbi:MAG: SusC/RagA family TonB-linked outer membrane protein [Mucilaginibacter sp.]
MKITFSQIVIAIAFTAVSYASTSKAQGTLERRLDINVHHSPLGAVLKQIEDETGLKFIYRASLVDAQAQVDLITKQETLKEILTELLRPRGIAFEVFDDKIVLSKIPKAPDESSSVNNNEVADEHPAANEVIVRSISGIVTDETNQPLPGVTVKVKGTSGGTVTDSRGRFSLTIPDGNPSIVFSYIGYVTQEIAVNNQTILNIQLKASPSSLNEVVVIGYGQQHKADVTSAVTTVKSEDFVTGPVTDPLELLKGKVAGLSVSNPSGDPNATTQIMLRGINTVGGTSQGVLTIIDGVPGDILTVAPEDIAEISVLKDASATAIYGVNGSDGVIIITTKRNSNGIKEVTYSGDESVGQQTRAPKLLTAQDYRNEIAAGSRAKSYDLGSSTNWLNAISNKFPVSNVQDLTFKGGNSQTSYLASLDYRFLQGVFLRNDHEQITGRIDVTHTMLDGKLKFNLGIVTTNFNALPFNQYDYEQMLKMNPTAPVKEPNGSYYQETTNFEYQNPVSDIYNTDAPETAARTKYNATVTLLPVEGLRLAATAAYTRFTYLNKSFQNFENISTLRDGQDGLANINSGQDVQHYFNFTADYSKSFGHHSFALLAGYEYQDDNSFSDYINNHEFPTDLFGYNNIGLGAAQANGDNAGGIGSGYATTNLISYFGRLTYNFDNRYLLLASLRIDGSSQFYGASQPYGRFPSIQGGWRITNEKFMRGQHIFDDLKLRVGYGVTGKPPLAGFLAVPLLGYSNYTFYNGQWIQTLVPTQNPNPDLKWEEKHETNVGLDYSLFKGRIYGSIDAYDNKTVGLLYNYSVPSPPNLYNQTYANAGTMENKGIEVALNIVPVKQKDVAWTSTFTFSTNANKLVSLSNGQYKVTVPYFPTGSTLDPVQTFTNIVQVGQPVGDLYGFKVVGVDKDGNWIYQEPNGKTVPYSQFNHAFGDKQVLGNGIPKFYAGWNNTISYKNWDFSVTMRGAFHFQILNLQRLYFENTSVENYNRLASSQNKVFGTAVLNKNMPEEFNSYYVENGDFWKIDNVNIGYTFKNLKSKYVHNPRIFFSTNNTFIITGYKGVDPEVNVLGLAPGVDSRVTYPTVRNFTIGASAAF